MDTYTQEQWAPCGLGHLDPVQGHLNLGTQVRQHGGSPSERAASGEGKGQRAKGKRLSTTESVPGAPACLPRRG